MDLEKFDPREQCINVFFTDFELYCSKHGMVKEKNVLLLLSCIESCVISIVEGYLGVNTPIYRRPYTVIKEALETYFQKKILVVKRSTDF